MIQKLQWKFTLLIMSLVSCVIIASFSLNYMSTKLQVEEEMREALLFIAQTENITSPWNVSIDFDTISVPFFALELYYSGQVVAIWDEYYHLTEDHLLRIATDVTKESKSHGTIPSLHLRYVCQETPQGFRIICSDLSFETQILQRLFRSSLLIAMCSLCLVFVISRTLSTLLLRPVAQAWEQQKQFVADASHELKTPLTVILSSAELLQTVVTPEAEKPQQWLENITAESQRMQRLIDDMLTLTKSQNDRSQSLLSLSEMVENAVMMLEPIAFEKHILFADEILDDLYIQGDGDQIQQLLLIILDNAMKYSTPKETVTITLKKEAGKSILFTVSNYCDEISPQACQQLFHRFYRLDASRSQKPGHGLGLSIAESIVQGHSGKIWAVYQKEQLHIHVKLPQKDKNPQKSPQSHDPNGNNKRE